MNTSDRKRLTISLTPEEWDLLSQSAKSAGITCNQYVKRAALEGNGKDVILRKAVIKTMTQFYLTVETLESVEDRRKVKAVADALWLCLK